MGSGVAMGRRGPGALPQAEKREQFARLIAQGFNNSEACRIVGINRRTGKRWRHGRTITTRDGRKLHDAAVVTTGAVRREVSPRYLSEDERVQIADLRQGGAGVRAIAERLRVAGARLPVDLIHSAVAQCPDRGRVVVVAVGSGWAKVTGGSNP